MSFLQVRYFVQFLLPQGREHLCHRQYKCTTQQCPSISVLAYLWLFYYFVNAHYAQTKYHSYLPSDEYL